MRERLLHALDLGMLGDWEAAKRSLENLDDPMVPRLVSLMTQQQRYERDRYEAQALARHELGNALSIAQANIEAMIDGILEPSTERLYGIRSALQTCGALLDDLKKPYPPQRQTTPRIETFDICKLIDAQIQLVSTIAESKNVRLSSSVGGNRDPGCASFRGDPDRIAHLVRNMLFGAVRYTPPGGSIDVEFDLRASELALSVHYSKDGRPDCLGFPLASKLLEALGSEARVTSESLSSNTFVVKLPALVLS